MAAGSAIYDRTIGEDRRRAMFAEVDLHAMNDRVDRGEKLPRGDLTKRPRPIRTGVYGKSAIGTTNWIELATPVIPHSVTLMRTLRKKGVPVYALTNFGIESFDYAQTQYDFLGEFDRPLRVRAHGRDQARSAHLRDGRAGQRACRGRGCCSPMTGRTTSWRRGRAAGWRITSRARRAGREALVAHGLLTEEEARP